jgi:hypothetical protein
LLERRRVVSDLKVVIKDKGEEFKKDPKAVLTELGLLKLGDELKPAAAGGVEPGTPEGGMHAHTIGLEAEAF